MSETSSDIRISVAAEAPAGSQATMIFIPQGSKPADGAAAGAMVGDGSEAISAGAARLLASGVSTGKAREIYFDILSGDDLHRRVYLAGLGPSEKITPEVLRQCGAAVVRTLQRHNVSSAALLPPKISGVELGEFVEYLVIGAELAGFCFTQYWGTVHNAKEEKKPTGLQLTILASKDQHKQVQAAVDRGRLVAEAQNMARTLASRPGNDINPPVLAQIAKDLARKTGLACKILDEKELAKLNMGGILGVGGGSIHAPPRLIALEYNPAPPASSASVKSHKKAANHHNGETLLLVGKAITFDTGGISIKPAEKMGKMIYDKCGGIDVLGVMRAVAQIKPPIRVVGLLAAAENVISSMAYRPGDILTMYNGVTVEITNTDAEGRLVLGDAIAWGIETYQPSAVIDLATLTGGVITALGRSTAGIMSNSDELVAELSKAADVEGEKIWRLPLWEEHREQIKSDCADIVNSAGREAHPLQGGAFLSYFLPSDRVIPWAHLDIAGVSDTEKELPCYGKGATGWGVRTLVRWINARAQVGNEAKNHAATA